jgi:DNA-binding NarL/FixJ family response regulator
MIGCRIEFIGERPADRGAARLLYAAVREALTNAVRHAGADSPHRLHPPQRRGLPCGDLGQRPGPRAHPGGPDGLGNLRRRLEQEGAALEIVCRQGVVLILELPCGSKKKGGKEPMIKCLLVEDSKISRETIESRISRSPDYLLLASIENAANAEIACMNGKVDLILMDVCTADDESGLKAAAASKSTCPGVKIIIMTSMPEHSFLQKAKDCGCDGFWYKEYGDADLLDVCGRVMRGRDGLAGGDPRRPGRRRQQPGSDGAGAGVLRELTMGRKYEEIAETLGIPPTR